MSCYEFRPPENRNFTPLLPEVRFLHGSTFCSFRSALWHCTSVEVEVIFFGWNCTVRFDSGDRGRILQGKLVNYSIASSHDAYRPSHFGFNVGPCVSRYNVYTRGVELPRTLGIIYLFIYLFLMNVTKQIRSHYPRYILWSSTCLLCWRTANLF